MKTISRNILLDYIEHEDIAFQFGDGLICITHPNGNYADEQLAESTAKSFEEVKEFIAGNHSIKVVNKEDVIHEKDELSFNEFAEWTIDTDLLILVNEYLLLCLSDPDTRDVIFDAA